MLYRYNTCIDYIFMIIGLIGAVLSGVGMPAFALLFRDLLNKFNPTSDGESLYNSIKDVSLYFLAVGGGLWIASYLMYAFFGVVATKVGYYY